MKLYDNPISGNCYKVRLMLSLLGREYQRHYVDSLNGDTKKPAFLAVSRRGQIPVLEDEGEIIHDSMAILVYLAKRYGPQWLPDEPLEMSRVMEWLAVAADELQHGAAQARRIRQLGLQGDLTRAQMHAEYGLGLIDKRLERHRWLAGERPTIADIACYPYVALLPEGGVPLDPYPPVRAWMERIEQLPGYVAMPGLEREPAA